jgi:hypothetical protein
MHICVVCIGFPSWNRKYACFLGKSFYLKNLKSFCKSNIYLWMTIFKPVLLAYSWNTILNGVSLACVILATFNFNYWRVINNPTVCMFKTQVTIASSSYSINTPWGPTFLLLVLLYLFIYLQLMHSFNIKVHSHLVLRTSILSPLTPS